VGTGGTAQRTRAGAEKGLTGGRTINCYAVPGESCVYISRSACSGKFIAKNGVRRARKGVSRPADLPWASGLPV